MTERAMAQAQARTPRSRSTSARSRAPAATRRPRSPRRRSCSTPGRSPSRSSTPSRPRRSRSRRGRQREGGYVGQLPARCRGRCRTRRWVPPPGRSRCWSRCSAPALSGGLVVLLFAVIIPAVGSLDGVWDAISSMSWERGAAVRRGAGDPGAARPGVRRAHPRAVASRSLIAREASSAVSNVVPGPSGTATQYVILRSCGSARRVSPAPPSASAS